MAAVMGLIGLGLGGLGGVGVVVSLNVPGWIMLAAIFVGLGVLPIFVGAPIEARGMVIAFSFAALCAFSVFKRTRSNPDHKLGAFERSRVNPRE